MLAPSLSSGPPAESVGPLQLPGVPGHPSERYLAEIIIHVLKVDTWCDDGVGVAHRRWSGLCAPLNFTPNLDGSITTCTIYVINLDVYNAFALQKHLVS